MNFSAELKAQLDTWVAKYPTEQKQSAVLPVLRLVQEANAGWLSDALMREVAQYLDMPFIAVYEVASFYSMLELKPVGKHKLCVCTNISCMLSGSDEIVKHLREKLNINFGETTEDGKYTLKEVECLGACANAPVMHIGHQYHEDLTTEKVDEILEGLK
jgi:NADH-quinone oxidoreductase subunit E